MSGRGAYDWFDSSLSVARTTPNAYDLEFHSRRDAVFRIAKCIAELCKFIFLLEVLGIKIDKKYTIVKIEN